MVDFIKVVKSPTTNKLYVEFIPDLYVKAQPINNQEFSIKIIEFRKIIKVLNDYSKSNNLMQVMVLDCDKCVDIFKINLVLFAKVVRDLVRVHKNADTLEEIQVLHTSPMIRRIFEALKLIIPSCISELVVMY
jgi:hypothetical protein